MFQLPLPEKFKFFDAFPKLCRGNISGILSFTISLNLTSLNYERAV